ncbi:MAG: LysM peptidoglycan-binding domain-containing protein [Steroidobacteraceae bacterium]
MKTATHPHPILRFRISPRRAAGFMTLAAAVTGTLLLALPATSGAQAEGGARTVATGSNIPLAPNAPDRYTVQSGDTLWSISKVFLRDAWYWPEIWYANPQVENPHRIYPGDILALTYVEGQPRISIEQRAATPVGGGATKLTPQIRSEALPQSITTLPYEVIAAFMGRPTMLDKAQVKSGPYIVAMRDSHIIGAAGNEVYARGLEGATVDGRYNIIHVGEPLRDPETRDILGYHGLYVGSGAVAQQGETTKLTLTKSTREALQGDKLFPEDASLGADFIPHAPPKSVAGAVMAVDDYSVLGQYQVVAINRGTRDGLEPGHVLAVQEAGNRVKDVYSHGGQASGLSNGFSGLGKNIALPEERTGLVMVFKANERMSYGLIMEATRPIRTGDLVAQP